MGFAVFRPAMRSPQVTLTLMNAELSPFRRYKELQAYVDWTDEDATRVRIVAASLESHLGAVVEDFYQAIERNDATRAIITGGSEQIARLKRTLTSWLRDLLNGPYDEAYVASRWRVGLRHVEIGLDQVYTNVALSRVRQGLLRALRDHWSGEPEDLAATALALNKLLDLDLAIIEDAYHSEYLVRQQRSERLATIGQVAGGVAHELRNPLNVIKTSVYYLLNARAVSDEKKAEHLRRIERHVEVSDGVITALSNFARLPVPDAQAFSAGKVVRDVLETNLMPSGISLEVDFPDDLPRVSADERQIQIVLANLVRNARDAMARGGTLAIRGRALDGAVEIRVIDTGVGISRDDLNRIMEPLYTTKARGLGLGLAIARAILEKNRGTLQVVSELGRGSEFIVRLLAAEPDDGGSP